MKNLILLISIFLLSACATHSKLIKDSDYNKSLNDFRAGDVEQSLADFPEKEKNGFITTSEKAWLGLWQDQKQMIDLEPLSKSLDERKQISISRETENFFLSQSEDGYIPGEHEIISLHLIAAMQFLKANQHEQALVEARRAAFYLQSYIPEDKPHFDNAALRLWLACIWTALGQWEDAVVDFRKAQELEPQLKLQELIQLKSAPKNLQMYFDGSGPNIDWDGISYLFSNPTPEPNNQIHADTLDWYKRHKERNSQIRKMIDNSNYMSEYFGIQASSSAKKTAGTAGGFALKAVGLIVGTAIVVGGTIVLASAHVSSSEVYGAVLGGGFLFGAYLFEQGNTLSQKANNWAEANKKEDLDKMHTYRFVRFLPNWVSIDFNNNSSDIIKTSYKDRKIEINNKQNKVVFIQRF